MMRLGLKGESGHRKSGTTNDLQIHGTSPGQWPDGHGFAYNLA
jgi:hypothetical protein